jgi:hypothetical protein
LGRRLEEVAGLSDMDKVHSVYELLKGKIEVIIDCIRSSEIN